VIPKAASDCRQRERRAAVDERKILESFAPSRKDGGNDVT